MAPHPDAEARRTSSRRAVLFVAGLSVLFLAGTFLAPALHSAGMLGNALYLVYAPLCHQLTERSLSLGGEPLAVCARCSGLYLGGAAGLLFAGLWALGRLQPRPRWLWIALLLTAIDVLLPRIGLTGLPELPRLVLAWPVGFLAGWFLALGIADLFRTRKTPSSGSVTRAPLAQENLHG